MSDTILDFIIIYCLFSLIGGFWTSDKLEKTKKKPDYKWRIDYLFWFIINLIMNAPMLLLIGVAYTLYYIIKLFQKHTVVTIGALLFAIFIIVAIFHNTHHTTKTEAKRNTTSLYQTARPHSYKNFIAETAIESIEKNHFKSSYTTITKHTIPQTIDFTQEPKYNNPTYYLPPTKSTTPDAKKYWINNNSYKTHNRTCQYYKNCDGHFSATGSGIDCKICGGEYGR